MKRFHEFFWNFFRTNCLNVLVTKTHLIQSFSKCLLFKLENFFPIENVYSASKVGKQVSAVIILAYYTAYILKNKKAYNN